MERKQVDKSHYSFREYMVKKRWLSLWHQIDEVMALSPTTILEIGPGAGIFSAIISHFGILAETVDIDPELRPDYLASVTKLPITDNQYDCVCCFQMLEHLPYEKSLQAFGEMVRVSKKHVILSLPDSRTLWPYSIHIPKLGQKKFHISKPWFACKKENINKEHYWEINKKGFSLKKVINDFTKSKVTMIRTFRVDEHPYHRFFIFKCM